MVGIGGWSPGNQSTGLPVARSCVTVKALSLPGMRLSVPSSAGGGGGGGAGGGTAYAQASGCGAAVWSWACWGVAIAAAENRTITANEPRRCCRIEFAMNASKRVRALLGTRQKPENCSAVLELITNSITTAVKLQAMEPAERLPGRRPS